MSKLERESDQLIKGQTFDFQKETRIVLQFSEKHIESISQKCFLNSHQTGNSQGVYTPEYRSQLEDEMIGSTLEPVYVHGLQNPVNKIRPKYAYLTFKKDAGELSSKYDALYGNVFAVIKDEVKSRSTFTPGDSLAMRRTQGHGKIAHTFSLKKNPGFKREGNYWEVQIWGKLCFSEVDKFLVNCPGMSKVSSQAFEKLKKTGVPVAECSTDL